MITATRKEITDAFKMWNVSYLEDRSKYKGDTENTTEYAERQADELIEFINKAHGE